MCEMLKTALTHSAMGKI